MDQAVASPPMLNTARVLFRGGSSRSGQPPTTYAIDVNGSFSSGPSQTSQRQQESLWEFEDIAAYARKNHTFRFGGSTPSRRFDVIAQSAFVGTFAFAVLSEFTNRMPSPLT